MENLIYDDPKKFFEFVNSSNKNVDDIPDEMMLGDKMSGNRGEKAQLFATHFATAYSIPEVDFLKGLFENFPTIDITEDLVMAMINVFQTIWYWDLTKFQTFSF